MITRRRPRRPSPPAEGAGQKQPSSWGYGKPAGRSYEPEGPSGQSAGWALFGYLVSGMAVYGAAGWLLARWLAIPLLFPLGMVFGLGTAIVLIVSKYGRG